MDGFSKSLFGGEVPFKVWDYFNCGFQIVNESHKEFFEYVRNYYLENQYEVQNAIDQVKASTDQTIINFLCNAKLSLHFVRTFRWGLKNDMVYPIHSLSIRII